MASNENNSEDKSTYNRWEYKAEKVVGQGMFGIVFKSIVVDTNEIVAVKTVYQDKKYKNRELKLLKELDHPNII